MKKLAKIAILLCASAFCLGASAQTNNLPPAGPGMGNPPPMGPGPGIGNGPDPAPGSDIYNPGTPPPPPMGAQPQPAAPSPTWGTPWGGPGPLVLNPPLSSPNWQNSGVTNVMACGTDAQGVWRTIPLRVSYTYDGAQYVVNVLAAWNPWTDQWNMDVDAPAFNTSYFLNGRTYDFYTNLSTGTWYFNL